ncbi:uncharacterized protein BKA55DRAFT_726092 [Fusarium redolens]|uniref:Uncharacterized protein n=1 Tax=Fusarium redolens TaxID=48865 RepID=A0A9P9KC62_FUSRE|nr:uncharacterized protein BKA55DRAFT_726092 [Fusarium redolens]KAH7255793.1 hypothetical protein BKA55DRAFT_726092 [Fusarium redolens]
MISHLSNRIPVRRNSSPVGQAARSSSDIFLGPMPASAEQLLVRHNQETLSIFKDFVQSYIKHHLADNPDLDLPLTKISVGARDSTRCSSKSTIPTVVRSPFAALSGFTDDPQSIKDLCSGVRSVVSLEESAIPYIPICPTILMLSLMLISKTFTSMAV